MATAHKDLLSNWREGVSIEDRTGAEIQELFERVVADRMDLAYRCRRSGKRVLDSAPPMYRDAIGRFYYAMYHSMRAVVYFVNRGDDFEAHSELPQRVPDDFPNVSTWKNSLKNARENRNRADYDASPKAENAWRSMAVQLESDADSLLPLARQYLRQKGCPNI